MRRVKQFLSSNAIVTSLGILLVGSDIQAASNVQYDLSSPEATFRTCGLAIKNDDPQAFYRAFAPPVPISYEDFLEHMWKVKDKEGRRYYVIGIESRNIQQSDKHAEYFLQGKFEDEIDRKTTKDGELRTYHVKWNGHGLIRKEEFLHNEKTGDWLWVFDPYPKDFALHDSYATPTDAYRSIGDAMFRRLDRELYRGLTSAVRGGLEINDYVKARRERLAKLPKGAVDRVWMEPGFTACKNCLEEEMFTGEDGRSMCRVWVLTKDAQGKPVRNSYKLFVKEGDEWKWIPDSKSFWNLKGSVLEL